VRAYLQALVVQSAVSAGDLGNGDMTTLTSQTSSFNRQILRRQVAVHYLGRYLKR